MEKKMENELDDTPIVLVPGFMASNLWRVRKGLLTLPVLAWPLNIYTLTAQLILLSEQYPLKAEGLVGNYYDGLIDFITRPSERGGLGRKRDENFWVFAYDWRQSCEVSGRELYDFICDKLARANALRSVRGLPAWEKVDIINHSMGGFVTRSAQVEYLAPVRRVVYIASGHYGVAKAFFALHPDTAPTLIDDFIKGFLPGWYWDLLKAFPNVWFLQNWLLRLVGSFQSMYELLPDSFYLDEEQSLIIDTTSTPPVSVKGVEDTYYKHAWQLTTAQQLKVRQAMRFKERLGRELPGQENLVIYCASMPTYAHANYDGQLEYPERLTIGDLTVTEVSANHDEKATRITVEGAHAELPNLPATHEAIRPFLLSSSKS